MPFQPGQSGNPNGANVKEKKFASALARAILQDNADRLRQAAEKLLDEAAAGQPWAIEQLANRLDGKPNQSVSGPDGNTPVSILVEYVKPGTVP